MCDACLTPAFATSSPPLERAPFWNQAQIVRRVFLLCSSCGLLCALLDLILSFDLSVHHRYWEPEVFKQLVYWTFQNKHFSRDGWVSCRDFWWHVLLREVNVIVCCFAMFSFIFFLGILDCQFYVNHFWLKMPLLTHLTCGDLFTRPNNPPCRFALLCTPL